MKYDIKEINKLARTLSSEGKRVFSHKELLGMLKRSKDSKEWNTEELLSCLVKEQLIDRRILQQNGNDTEFVRYLYNNPSVYEVALSLKSGSYLSHGTAVYLHGLNNQLPKVVYANKEQSKKPTVKKKLTQEEINQAFSLKQRESKVSILMDDYEIVLLNGKSTDRLHVIGLENHGYPLQVTSIERTLVDIAVRPNYAGGTSQVLEAYRGALGRASVNTIQAILKKLEYIYPYHQVVGFYLDTAGYPKEQVAWLKERFPIECDFFLEYAIPEIVRDYSSEWRLFYPKGL